MSSPQRIRIFGCFVAMICSFLLRFICIEVAGPRPETCSQANLPDLFELLNCIRMQSGSPFLQWTITYMTSQLTNCQSHHQTSDTGHDHADAYQCPDYPQGPHGPPIPDHETQNESDD